MADPLIARTPLGSSAHAELKTYGVASVVLLTELTPAAMIDLRLDPADSSALQSAQNILGLQLPLTPNRSSANDRRTAWWLGPDQWLIVSATGDAAKDLQSLNAVAPSAVDVSDLRAEFELTGPRSMDVLRKGCGIDLHPRVFHPGDCALTALARVRVGLMQIDERPAYRILAERSIAPYLWDWLADAMREFIGG